MLSSSPRFRVRGLTRGARVATLRRRLRGERSYRVGRNRWYAVRGAKATLVFRTRRGRVGAVGLASRRLTAGPRRHAAAAARLAALTAV